MYNVSQHWHPTPQYLLLFIRRYLEVCLQLVNSKLNTGEFLKVLK